AADFGQSRIGKLISQLFRGLRTVMCGAPGTDNADGVMVAFFQFAPNVKHNWRRMDFAQRLWIGWRPLSDDSRAQFANAPKLRGKVDSRFPVADLIGHFAADSFNFSKLVAFRSEN